ncbi:hypothetical protein V3F56_13790 [Moorellaceae bacterium AZ2]
MRASNELEDVYTRLINSFVEDRRYAGFDKHKEPEARNLRELAGVLYRWFDVHFYKVLDAVTYYEVQYPGPFTSILRQSEVTVADIGAGIGTFSIALADFIFQKRSKSRVQKLNVVLVEQNTMYQDYARWFFQR